MNMVIFTIGNLKTTAGNVTLMQRRATALFIEKGIFTTFLIMERNNDTFIYLNGDGYCYRIVRNKEELYKALNEIRPEYVVYYGGRSYFYRFKIKRYLEKKNCECIHLLDVQGAVEETKEYGKGFKNRAIIYAMKKLLFAYMINHVDGAFVVSDELMEYCKKNLFGSKKRLQISKVRCCVTQTLDTEMKLKYRNSARKKLGIDDKTIVFVYSGYRMAWQNVDNIIEQFKIYDNELPNSYFAFFCDTDKDFEKQLERAFPQKNFCAMLIPQTEYFEYLCACDVGYLLRDYNTTNKVAFPNKFSDYVNAGLLIGINKALPEPCRILEHYSVSYIDTDIKPDQFAIDLIFNRQSELNKYYNLCEELSKNELEFSEQIRRIEI
jgi:glycosyltransferase involved in cell wall biosynthesis